VAVVLLLLLVEAGRAILSSQQVLSSSQFVVKKVLSNINIAHCIWANAAQVSHHAGTSGTCCNLHPVGHCRYIAELLHTALIHLSVDRCVNDSSSSRSAHAIITGTVWS